MLFCLIYIGTGGGGSSDVNFTIVDFASYSHITHVKETYACKLVVYRLYVRIYMWKLK